MLSVRGALVLIPGSEDGGSTRCPLEQPGGGGGEEEAAAVARRRRLPRQRPVSLDDACEDSVILGGRSFKENAAMRPSDAFEALIMETDPGV